ncbi:TCF21 (predicted) [Pycnogonum litorale]
MARRRKENGRTGTKGKPIQRNAANARERARMRVLSKAFSRLKTTLPWVPADTKLSKLDTLRLASSYIAHLREILQAEVDTEYGEEHRNVRQAVPNNVHPLNLTWPFSFSNRTKDENYEEDDHTDNGGNYHKILFGRILTPSSSPGFSSSEEQNYPENRLAATRMTTTTTAMPATNNFCKMNYENYQQYHVNVNGDISSSQ